MDFRVSLASADLAALVEFDLGSPANRGGGGLFWHCPFHTGDATPSLWVTPKNGRYFCFGCRRGGDAITWLREYRGMTFRDACEALSGGVGTGRYSGYSSMLAVLHPTAPDRHTPDELQAPWNEIIHVCERALWEPAGLRARDYLHRRGLQDDTLKNPLWRVGYSPGIRIAGVWVERGIVLPCFTTTPALDVEYVHYIKMRRPTNSPKYKKLPGNGADLSGLYGSEWIQGRTAVFMTEGEFDALLLWQQAGDLIGVGTLGSAAEKFNFARFGKYLLSAKWILPAYDNDPAGVRGAEAWTALSGRVHPVTVPQGKDITEFFLAGGKLSEWVRDSLAVLNENIGPQPET